MFARIYRPAKTAMQSGRAETKQWVLVFEQEAARKIDPLMGWTSATDMASGQVRLEFDSKEQAIRFAKEHGIPHRVIDPKTPTASAKAYADNFAYQRRKAWTH